MQNGDSERTADAFFQKALPLLPELFNTAHVICGNDAAAEYAVQAALAECWAGEPHGGPAMREMLRSAVRRVAAEEAYASAEELPEPTWDGLPACEEGPLLALLRREKTEVQRMAVLRYGCGLSVLRTAALTMRAAGAVRDELDRFVRAARRRLPAKERARCEARLGAELRKALRLPSPAMPSPAVFYRAFATETVDMRTGPRLPARILRALTAAVLVLVCAGAFWLMAVLIQPPVLEAAEPANGIAVQSEAAG